jgi:N-acetylglucosaminyl-diphospho-decaprenol L-rhamnosyltransferase
VPGRDITLSIVSHGQNMLVNQLLGDIWRHSADRVALVLTENIPDETPLDTGALSCPVDRIVNNQIKGFGANHNAAFKLCKTPRYCVVNPDIRLPADPFPSLAASLDGGRAGVAGPLVRSPSGSVEDSARRFPTAAALLKKFFREKRQPDYPVDHGQIEVDWVAGMFMLFDSAAFRSVGGFDESYFLYYEDVDLCRRLHAAGRPVIYNPAAEVVHDAQRASRRKPGLAVQHLKSALRFLANG